MILKTGEGIFNYKINKNIKILNSRERLAFVSMILENLIQLNYIYAVQCAKESSSNFVEAKIMFLSIGGVRADYICDQIKMIL